MRDEVEQTMKLIGATSLADLHRGLVNTQDLDHLVFSGVDTSESSRWLRSKL